MEEKNVLQKVWEIFIISCENLADDIKSLKAKKNSDYKSVLPRMIFTAVVLIIMITAFAFFAYYVVALILFLYDSVIHLPYSLKVILGGLSLIGILYIALALFKKNVNDDELTHEEAMNNYQHLLNILFRVLGHVSEYIGITPILSEDFLISPNLKAYEKFGNVIVYQFSCLKRIDFDETLLKTFNPCKIIQDILNQFERSGKLFTSKPQGYKYRNRTFCSVLVLSVIDSGTHIKINLVLASDEACELYLNTPRYEKETKTADDNDDLF